MSRKIAIFLMAIAILAFAHSAGAQQAKVYRIGFLSVASSSPMLPRVEEFRRGLRELGYVEGQNIAIEYRWGEGIDERLTGLAAELVRLKVDIMVVHGVVATLAARQATTTIPIVCFACGDAVSTGLVESLARPGGNVTGQTLLAPEAIGKRLELLKEVIPGLTRVAVLLNSSNPVSGPELRETETAARSLGLQLQSLSVTDPRGFESAFSSMNSARADALIVLSDAMFFGQRGQIADLATANRLPAISWFGDFAKSGGLMSYGPDVLAMARRAATYVDKIRNGAKPADLPIEQPTRFEFMINLKTAKALGITIPPTLLVRADEVIE
ncbi:MAG: ABC transporter substrate-binding protein [Proteobacteria bacterium]|nr:ABC transporter substrate-binding protein [Pseudomonadota bacterium]